MAGNVWYEITHPLLNQSNISSRVTFGEYKTMILVQQNTFEYVSKMSAILSRPHPYGTKASHSVYHISNQICSHFILLLSDMAGP